MDSAHAWRSPTGPLVEGPDPDRRERRWAAGLLVLTVGCVCALQSVTFAVVLIGILAAHELAHRAAARAHRVEVGWPLFLPAPFFVGTLGAIIRFRRLPRDRTALVEIGASGPIAGAVVIVLALVARTLWAPLPAGGELGRPLLFRAAGAPATEADPVLYACWVGCLVTGMNLLPLGQLDGGHVGSGLWPAGGRRSALAAGALVLLLGVGWSWWWLWLVALGLLGGWRPVEGLGGELTPRSRLAGAAAALSGVLCFVPLPW